MSTHFTSNVILFMLCNQLILCRRKLYATRPTYGIWLHLQYNVQDASQKLSWANFDMPTTVMHFWQIFHILHKTYFPPIYSDDLDTRDLNCGSLSKELFYVTSCIELWVVLLCDQCLSRTSARVFFRRCGPVGKSDTSLLLQTNRRADFLANCVKRKKVVMCRYGIGFGLSLVLSFCSVSISFCGLAVTWWQFCTRFQCARLKSH